MITKWSKMGVQQEMSLGLPQNHTSAKAYTSAFCYMEEEQYLTSAPLQSSKSHVNFLYFLLLWHLGTLLTQEGLPLPGLVKDWQKKPRDNPFHMETNQSRVLSPNHLSHSGPLSTCPNCPRTRQLGTAPVPQNPLKLLKLANQTSLSNLLFSFPWEAQ